MKKILYLETTNKIDAIHFDAIHKNYSTETTEIRAFTGIDLLNRRQRAIHFYHYL